MVKRMLIAALMVALLLSCAVGWADGAQATLEVPGVSQSDMEGWPILAPTLDVPDLSGTADWPIFRGLQWSMDENVVLLLEQTRGVELTAFGDASVTRRYRNSAPVEVLGYEAGTLQYEFSDDMGLCNITVGIQVEGGEAERDAALEALSASITAALGEPLDSEYVGSTDVTTWSRPVESAYGAGNGAWYALGKTELSAVSGEGGYTIILRLSGGVYVWKGN